MKFEISKLTIGELIDLWRKKKILLSPPYQRNEIWSTGAKELLIDSIIKNYPIPNFFVRLQAHNTWEIVDGQQRTRAIIQYYNQELKYQNCGLFDEKIFPEFLKYELAIIFISDLKKSETIEDFYVRVNSTGMKLNRPELKKAEYYDRKFLKLLNELATEEKFLSLGLFTESSLNRMNDVDFVSELVAQLIYGLTDKKDKVDEVFEIDISKEQYDELRLKFIKIIEIFHQFDSIYSFKRTRYRQRNDFYSLFGFVNKHQELSVQVFIHIYETLYLIQQNISPSNEECEPLKKYALNCVSQSNSKNARQNRLEFLEQLFINRSTSANIIQEQILSYYLLNKKHMITIDGYLLIDNDELKKNSSKINN